MTTSTEPTPLHRTSRKKKTDSSSSDDDDSDDDDEDSDSDKELDEVGVSDCENFNAESCLLVCYFRAQTALVRYSISKSLTGSSANSQNFMQFLC